MKRGRIWITAKDPVDGYFVEILEQIAATKKVRPGTPVDWQVDSSWQPTVEECQAWAETNGAVTIEMFDSSDL